MNLKKEDKILYTIWAISLLGLIAGCMIGCSTIGDPQGQKSAIQVVFGSIGLFMISSFIALMNEFWFKKEKK